MTSTSPGIHLYVQAIPTLLEVLRANPPPEGGVLSAYLPVRPVQVAGQAYLVRFREAAALLMTHGGLGAWTRY